MEILISFRPNPENLIRVQEVVAVTKEKQLPSDYIAPTRNAIHLSQMPITLAQVTEKENTYNVHAGVALFAHYDFVWFHERRGRVIVLQYLHKQERKKRKQ